MKVDSFQQVLVLEDSDGQTLLIFAEKCPDKNSQHSQLQLTNNYLALLPLRQRLLDVLITVAEVDQVLAIPAMEVKEI